MDNVVSCVSARRSNDKQKTCIYLCDLDGIDFLWQGTVVNIVVQFDRISGEDSSFDNWTDCQRFLVTAGMTPTVANAISDWVTEQAAGKLIWPILRL